MAEISIEGVVKEYPNGFRAIEGVDLRLGDGEFLVLVGPSGCGKSTLLRTVAGLEEVTEGRILIGGDDVTHAEPRKRDIAMVFQSYALYPHMSVADNIGYPLKLAGVAKAERRRRVEEVAGQLELTEELDRRPSQLSGGQRQRVAMGRAIVREPQAFLMDEPLSNLDAKLRVQMRAQIAALQRELGVTTLYVTHDQVEAMTMGDRVAVLNGGRIEQCAAPRDLYDHPVNLFVARFIGSPAINLFDASVTAGSEGPVVRLANGVDVAVPPALCEALGDRHKAVVGLRPEAFHLATGTPEAELVTEFVEELGSEQLVHGKIGSSNDVPCVAKLPPGPTPRPGDRLPLAVDTSRMLLFDPESERSLASTPGPDPRGVAS